MTRASLKQGSSKRSSLKQGLGAVGVIAAFAFGGAAACAGDPPEVGDDDPALVLGRDIYANRCVTCHGASGGGGTGVAINGGRLLEAYPDAEDQKAVIAAGRGRMPSFSSLSDEELDAVVRYTREIIDSQ